jgi:hypothetical protein
MAGNDRTSLTPVPSQQELLEFFQQAGRAWLDRAQSEAALWSELATKLTTTRTVPEAFQAYSACVSEQMRMSAEDAQRLFQDFQKITQTLAKSVGAGLGTGWRGGST